MTGCPDPETMARFIEGSLAAAPARATEDHLDLCADCRRQVSTMVGSPLSSAYAGGCLGTDTLLDFVENRATPDQRAAVERHASRCAECRRVLSSLAGTTPASDGPPSGDAPTVDAASEPARNPLGGLRPGDTVSRYVIRARLGAGGMGVVYAAFDPELGREVAIKLLHSRLGSTDARTMLEERLRREARALAQLAHPNVVAVYDVGRVGDQLFIAMELVEGPTVSAWCRAEPRSPRAVLERFVAAGRGLAAAHAAGIVHRDVKPENMMIGKDDRVRVVDFGLARTAASDPDPESSTSREVPTASANTLTMTGTVMGTPHYMAPEQHRGEEADARTDQFAFCVGMYVALYNIRPFAGEDMAALAAAVNAGELREPPRTRGVPGRIWRVLRRGLSAAPADRWPSLDALLAQIATDRYRRWVPIAASVGAAALAATAAVVITSDTNTGAAACSDVTGYLTGVWDAPRRKTLRLAVAAGGSVPAAKAFERVAAALDGYVADWSRAQAGACAATYRRGEQSVALFDARMACLGGQLAQVDALVTEVAAHPGPELIQKSINAALALPPADQCSAQALTSRGAPARYDFDPVRRAQAARIDQDLGRASALYDLAEVAELRAVLDRLVPETEALGDPVRRARALYRLGVSQTKNYDNQVAEASLLEAARLAAQGGDDRTVAEALIDHLGVVNVNQSRTEEAAVLKHAVERELARAPFPELRARFEFHLGLVALKRQKHEEGARHGQKALALIEEVHGPDAPQLAGPLRMIGMAAGMGGDHEAAMAAFERALALIEKRFGPDHADVAGACSLLATEARSHGDLATARAYGERALAIREALFGPDHPFTTHSLTGLAQTAVAQGRREEAEKLLERVIAIEKKRLGPDHWQRVDAMKTLAGVLVEQGKTKQALALLEEAIAIAEREYGPRDPSLFEPMADVATILAGQGRCREVRELARRAGRVDKGPQKADVLAGERLAGALRTCQRGRRPASEL